MEEPLPSGVEPAGMSPVGASGMPVRQEPVEPVQKGDEPSGGEEGDEPTYEDVQFDDLKTVPPQFQKIAKQMQASFTKAMQNAKREPEPPKKLEPAPNPTMDEAKGRISEYMSTPEGAALKEVFDSMIEERLGTLPQEVMEQKIEKEVGQVIKKYGEKTIADHYDEIESAAKERPDIPLDYLVSNILYEKAKNLGAEEYKSKIIKKASFSDPAPKPASSVVSNKPASSFSEAFESAKAELGY